MRAARTPAESRPSHGSRASLCAVLALLAPLGTSCSRLWAGGYRFDYEGERAERVTDGRFPPETRRVVLAHRFGELRVLPVDEADAPGWQWTLHTWADEASAARRYLEAIRLEKVTDGVTTTLRLVLPEPPQPELRGVRSQLTVFLPEATALELANEHGDTHVRGIAGPLVARTAHGDANYEGLAGSPRIAQAHGDLRVRAVAGELSVHAQHGDVRIAAAAGGLHARGEHADWTVEGLGARLDLAVEHGDASVDGSFEVARLRAEHGDLVLACRSADLSEVDARVEHGDVELRLAPGVTVHASLSVEHGSVRSELEETRGGRAALDVRAAHGDVRLVRLR